MRKTRGRLDEMFSVPVDAEMKKQVVQLADSEERRPADMVRVLVREALEWRRLLKEIAATPTEAIAILKSERLESAK